MPWHPDPQISFFKRDQAIRGLQRRRDLLAVLVLAIAVLVAVGIREAWNHGIIASVAHGSKLIVVTIWNMLCDVANAIEDFFKLKWINNVL